MPKPVASKELREQIRKAYQAGEGTFEELAAKFGVSLSAIENWSRRCRWNSVTIRQKVTEKVTEKLADDLASRLKRAFNWPIEKWARTITGVASFDPSMLYETTPEGEPRLRKDWIEIARKHGALESIKATMMTLENGMVVQKLETKAYSRVQANEKIGKVLGYDVTKDNEPPPVQLAVILNVAPLNDE